MARKNKQVATTSNNSLVVENNAEALVVKREFTHQYLGRWTLPQIWAILVAIFAIVAILGLIGKNTWFTEAYTSIIGYKFSGNILIAFAMMGVAASVYWHIFPKTLVCILATTMGIQNAYLVNKDDGNSVRSAVTAGVNYVVNDSVSTGNNQDNVLTVSLPIVQVSAKKGGEPTARLVKGNQVRVMENGGEGWVKAQSLNTGKIYWMKANYLQ